MYDRAVPFDEVVAAARAALERLLEAKAPLAPRSAEARASQRRELESALEQLRAIGPLSEGTDEARVPDRVAMVVEPDRDAPLSFGAEFAIRERARRTGEAIDAYEATPETVERSDMHALLFRGKCAPRSAGRTIDLGDCHPVLVAERLVELARRAFDAWERGLALNARGRRLRARRSAFAYRLAASSR